MVFKILDANDLNISTTDYLIDKLRTSVNSSEMDGKIAENMIGEVDWSLSTWLKEGFLSHANHGRVYLTLEENILTSISCSYVQAEKVLELPGIEYRVACRMWIHPQAHFKFYPTYHHVGPSVPIAQSIGATAIWTSFNEDRMGMAHKLEKYKTHKVESVRKMWENWTIQYEPVKVNNTMQGIVYLKL